MKKYYIYILNLFVTIFFSYKFYDAYVLTKSEIIFDARSTQLIDSHWDVIAESTDDLYMMLFYKDIEEEYQFSIYSKEDSKFGNYSFKSGGKSVLLENSVVVIVDDKYKIISSFNKSEVVEITVKEDGVSKKILVNEEEPFAIKLKIDSEIIDAVSKDGNSIDIYFMDTDLNPHNTTYFNTQLLDNEVIKNESSSVVNKEMILDLLEIEEEQLLSFSKFESGSLGEIEFDGGVVAIWHPDNENRDYYRTRALYKNNDNSLLNSSFTSDLLMNRVDPYSVSHVIMNGTESKDRVVPLNVFYGVLNDESIKSVRVNIIGFDYPITEVANGVWMIVHQGVITSDVSYEFLDDYGDVLYTEYDTGIIKND
jgi:hypothetical protein